SAMQATHRVELTRAVKPWHSRVPSTRALAIAVSVALSTVLCAEQAAATEPALPKVTFVPNSPARMPSQMRTVKNCNDSGTDSLPDIIENVAQPGDTIDLSQLSMQPPPCGVAQSTITLSSGAINVAQDDLGVYGPTSGAVTISGDGMSRVFHHTGTGTLSLT